MGRSALTFPNPALIVTSQMEAALTKIVDGRLNGFFKENVLVDQAFAKDPKKSVAQVLAEVGGTATGFVRYRVGA